MMKTLDSLRNTDINTLIARLRNEQMRKHDMIVPASEIEMDTDGTLIVHNAPIEPGMLEDALGLSAMGIAPSEDSDRADLRFDGLKMMHKQLANKLGIPTAYYMRMWDVIRPTVADNVNAWLHQEYESRSFMLRTFRPENGGSGIARAFLSDRYNIIDNLDMLFTMLGTMKKLGIKAKIHACNLTETNMYVSLTAPTVTIQAPELLRHYRNPDSGGRSVTLTAGLVYQNSEVGQGRFWITPRPIADVCMNALTWKPHSLSRVHLGQKLDEGVIEWKEGTRQKNMELIEAMTKDAVETFLSRDYLNRLVAVMLKNGEREVEHPVDCVQNVCKSLSISDEEQNDILKHFTRSGDMRAVGVAQALTYHAQRVEDADRQFEIEAGIADVLTDISKYDISEN